MSRFQNWKQFCEGIAKIQTAYFFKSELTTGTWSLTIRILVLPNVYAQEEQKVKNLIHKSGSPSVGTLLSISFVQIAKMMNIVCQDRTQGIHQDSYQNVHKVDWLIAKVFSLPIQ